MQPLLRLLILGAITFVGLPASGWAANDTLPPGEPRVVVVKSGALGLQGLVWYPARNGRHPAVLFNHGRGCTPQPACDQREEKIRELGPLFARRGYVFFALFRRGEGLSHGQGRALGELLEEARKVHGDDAANALQVRLLEADQLDDARAGLAFLRADPRVDARRVALLGHSFGGALSLLLAEGDSTIRAVICFAVAAESWQRSRQLRERLVAAVRKLRVPLFLGYASNDYSVLPGQVLADELQRAGKPHRLELFPAQGTTPAQGHWLIYLGAPTWEEDVFSFLAAYTKP